MPTKAKFDATQNKIAELRKNLAELIFEVDKNIFHESKYLEKEYMEKIGQLEFQSFKTQCDILRIRRKTEIVKELIDNNRVLDLEFVEKILDIDFEENKATLQEQENLLKLALTQTDKFTLSAAEDVELNLVYKNLIDLLNPDLNREQSEEANALYKEGVTAFAKKDLSALQKIMEKALAYTNDISATEPTLLAQYVTTLGAAIKDLQEQQKLLTKSFPFVTLSLLHDDDQLNAKIHELNEHISYYEYHLARFENQLKELVASRTN
ncbi:hypothetical protein SDC9_75196 [bioreactor metagenome]|uniref:Uncharacterized protein n=1 Tax=bioreactor metagenome TaxID=1076179 RepID=A0A644YK14_9ZZZZ